MSDERHPDTPPPPPRLEQPRHGGNHMFMSPPNQRERDGWALARWQEGWTYQAIADGLEVTKACAIAGVQRARRTSQAADAEANEHSRAVHRGRLEALYEEAMEILEREHVTVSHGRIVLGLDGKPIPDDGPKLQAIDRLRQIIESARRLDGLDAPAKSESTVTVTPQDAELQERLRLARERVQAEEQGLLDGDPEA